MVTDKIMKTVEINCPVCNNHIKPKTNKKNEIIVCPVCNNSIFVRKEEKDIKIMPFKLDMTIEIENPFVDREYNSDFDSMLDFLDDFQ